MGTCHESENLNPGTTTLTKYVKLRIATLTTLITIAAVLTACSALPLKKPQAPVVSVAAVRPLNLSFTRQRLAFSLNVKNPNPYDLPLEGLDFVATFAGEKLATGESNDEVTLPAKGEAIVEVEVTAALKNLVSQFQSMLNSGDIDLQYGITGNVKLANWPTRIPFDVEGELETPAPPEKL